VAPKVSSYCVHVSVIALPPFGKKPTMKIPMIAALSIATTLPLAAIAHADTQYEFQSPSGNIVCVMWVPDTGAANVGCQANQFTYATPPPDQCNLGGWAAKSASNRAIYPTLSASAVCSLFRLCQRSATAKRTRLA
jgi:hypothetical protein